MPHTHRRLPLLSLTDPIRIEGLEPENLYGSLYHLGRCVVHTGDSQYSAACRDLHMLTEAQLSLALQGIEVTFEEYFRHRAGMAVECGEENAAALEALRAHFDEVLTHALLDRTITDKDILDAVSILEGAPVEQLFRSSLPLEHPTGETDLPLYYAPPAADELEEYWKSLTAYMARTDLHPILQAGVVHGQVLLMQPAERGGGLIARLVSMFLPCTALEDYALLGMSFEFFNWLGQYAQAVQALVEKGDWNAWLSYYLEATLDAAVTVYSMPHSVENVLRDVRKVVKYDSDPVLSRQVYFALEQPIFSEDQAASALKGRVEPEGFRKVMTSLIRKGLVERIQTRTKTRSAVYKFPKLFQRFELDDIVSERKAAAKRCSAGLESPTFF